MTYITDSSGQIVLPNQPGLLEWLRNEYPFSDYRIVEADDDNYSQDSLAR